MKPIFTSINALNSKTSLFYDPKRLDSDNTGPFIIICDDFYDDPLAVRQLALAQIFFQYKPPLAAQVGDDIAAEYDASKMVWESSSLLRYLGKTVAEPEPGYRHATSEVREALANVINEHIVTDTWHAMGDWWNGAFHLQYEAGENVHRVIHHHYREGDISPRGWSGLVYLSPNAPKQYGTTIWRDKKTSRCIASKGNKYDADISQFELMLSIENKFNRLVLFRENVLHRAGHGFGYTPETARLMQTFFFQSNAEGPPSL
ncbi:hypothetical protein A9Q79_05335 [Methylophaga sp. 42_25_T18]|nr:hypothetical protein A9Q79_05335 [Methylophaga sp. 42_25_T18]OUR89207.1 hypothetical protein A9Q92_01360 [Methylophaga sp. 42_8_T64]